jgi:hypothetical protein
VSNLFATSSEIPKLGPAFMATFESDDACCGEGIVPGEDIRSDGEGGWIHADDSCERIATRAPRRLEAALCPRCTANHPGEC